MARSLNISTGGSGPSSPASLSPPSLEDQVNRVENGDFILRSPQSLSKHQNKSSRKQISPQHIDLTNTDREVCPYRLYRLSQKQNKNTTQTNNKQKTNPFLEAYIFILMCLGIFPINLLFCLGFGCAHVVSAMR